MPLRALNNFLTIKYNDEQQRRKTAADASPQGNTCPFYNVLPEGILEEVAKFLAPTSRILFAAAVTPTPRSPYGIILARNRPNVGHSLIASNDWHTLDFGDIEKELAAKLSDDDISEALLHIDAANKVKRLRLTNCTSITGACLSPLLGCTSIEQIDLSLVGAHQPTQEDYLMHHLSCDLVLPILDSIISQERCSLKHLRFPDDWRYEDDPDDPRFLEFLVRYNAMLENNLTACCGTRLDHGIISFDDCELGIQDWTCNECAKYYCCECIDGDDNSLLRFCHTCERKYCTTCVAMVECVYCDAVLCVDCAPHTDCANPSCTNIVCNDCLWKECGECRKRWCSDCSDRIECKGCYKRCCEECCEKEGVDGVHWCDVCETKRCDKCRLNLCQTRDSTCKECVNMISSLLLKENEKKQREIENLEYKNEELRRRLRDIRAMTYEYDSA